jgi:hypothetical protein
LENIRYQMVLIGLKSKDEREEMVVMLAVLVAMEN